MPKAFASKKDSLSWLPGFEPDKNPLFDIPLPSKGKPPQIRKTAVPVQKEIPKEPQGQDVSPEIDALVVAAEASITEPLPECLPVAPWPRLDALQLQHVGGQKARLQRNIEAITLLQDLQQSNQLPSDDERIILSSYTGWGALSGAFKPDAVDDWKKMRDRLQALLTPDEMESASMATPNSNFTEPHVIEAMWKAVEGFGFTGGRVLEPAAGNGLFLGLMPEAISARSLVTAVELDDISAQILACLYGHKANVLFEDFAKTLLPEGAFDLVITNVPFGDYPVPCMRRAVYSKWSIHNYFIARSIEMLASGGIAAVITSQFTMDQVDQGVRMYLASQAKLLGAIRLPKNTFGDIGGTEVTADILFFRKWKRTEIREEVRWADAAIPPSTLLLNPTFDSRYNFSINEYFIENPSNLLGKLALASNGYGQSQALIREGITEDRLQARVDTLPKGIFVPREKLAHKEQDYLHAVRNCGNQKSGSYVEMGSDIYVADGPVLKEFAGNHKAKLLERIRGLIRIRDAARTLITSMSSKDSDDEIAGHQRHLSQLYDRFVAKLGVIHERANALAMRSDPDWPLLLSLEKYDEDTHTATKADMFERRTINPPKQRVMPQNEMDALILSLQEIGRIDAALMAQHLGKPPADILATLECSGRIFLNPQTGEWETSDQYLSGNVRVKLAEAKAAGLRFERNAKALVIVMPEDLRPDEISVALGQPWIPERYIKQFVDEEIALTKTVGYDALTGTWDIQYASHGLPATATLTFGTQRINGVELVMHSLNQQDVSITDPDPYDHKKRVVNAPETAAAREKMMAIHERFGKWVFEKATRTKDLVRLYNDRYNSIVERKYDGSFLTLPGFTNCVELDPHQKDGIWRVVSSGNTLLAHCVGAGKTLTAICASMECRRFQIMKKPMHVVPNHMLQQYTAEFVRAYPTANVLMISAEDLEKTKRREFCARISTGDWDAVIMTHASFERVSVSSDYALRFVKDELAMLEAATYAEKKGGNSKIVKQLATMKKRWAVRFDRLTIAKMNEADTITFEELGVDGLFIDEAQYFKNLFRFSKMSRISGLPQVNAERAFDMYLKTRYVMDVHDGEQVGVVFMTGTPISNTVAEMHVMQRYLQPKTLQQYGIVQFDAWAANFGKRVTAMEVAPDGSGYRFNTRFAAFQNLPDLMSIFRMVSDIRTREMLKLPTPPMKGGAPQTIVAPGSKALKAYVKKLVARAQKVKNRAVKPHEDNMLKITSDGRKAGLDMRLVEPSTQNDPEAKVNLCAKKVYEIWLAGMAQRHTQMVFCDLSTPTDAKFSVYTDLRDQLVYLGIPAGEIAFIHDYDTDARKAVLFEAMRAGRIRVLIGSTVKMGVGTNVQKRLKALHNLDAPWRPSDVEQRIGRIERRGNEVDEIEVYNYVTEGSFDAYMWQTLEVKCRFIAQIMSGDRTIRTIEDVDAAALTYAEVKALATGNPMIIEKAKIDAEVTKLSLLHTQHKRQRANEVHEVATLPDWITSQRATLTKYTRDAKKLAADRTIAVNGKTYTSVDALAGDLEGILKKMAARRDLRNPREYRLGKIGSLELLLVERLWGNTAHLAIQGECQYPAEEASTQKKIASELERLLELPASSADSTKKHIPILEKRLSDLSVLIDKPFEHLEKLEKLYDAQAEMASLLDLDKSQAGTEAVEAELETV